MLSERKLESRERIGSTLTAYEAPKIGSQLSNYTPYNDSATNASTAIEETKNRDGAATDSRPESKIAVNDQAEEEKEEVKEKEKKSTGAPKWFGRKNLPGQGLYHKFMNFENKLIRHILEKQGFREST